jgi:hypothetical protein
MTQSEIDERQLSKLIQELSRPVKSLDWREFHFFKEQGLSKRDLITIRVCLDYELARESSRVRAFVKQLSQGQRRQLLEPQRLDSRYVPVRSSDEPEQPNVPKWSDVTNSSEALDLVVPAACIAASWFPQPWLCGLMNERRLIVKQLQSVYSMRPLSVFEFPLEEETAKLLTSSAQADGNTTLHVIAINREQTRATLLKAFKVWLGRENIKGGASQQGRHKFTAALSDLGCYRLMTKLDSQARAHAMNTWGFRRSIPKLSEGKARAAKRLDRLGYV